VQEYDRKRAKSPGVRKRLQSVAREWRKKNPDAYKAQNAVSNAVRDGRLNKEPCLFCGATKVHAHHRDYSRPLDVIWLCPKCHHRLHAAFPETEGANKRSDGEVQA
jgi:ribosomal protein S27AE